MRWFVAAVGLGTLLLIVAIVTGWGLQAGETTPLNDLVFFVFFTVLAIGLPGACAIAILRYRLYELDLVVKKTVLYAVVALVLVAIFFVFAVLVGRAFIEANPLAILGSIAIGLLFWPVVRLARRIADRVVYGGRATPVRGAHGVLRARRRFLRIGGRPSPDGEDPRRRRRRSPGRRVAARGEPAPALGDRAARGGATDRCLTPRR